MNYEAVFNQVAILCIMILVGYYACKRDILNREANQKLSDLLLSITLPCMILTSFQFDFSAAVLYDAGRILIIASLIHLFSAGVAKALYKKSPWQTASVLRFATIFSNAAFMGFPVIDSLYSQIGVFYTAIYVVVFNLFAWSYGVVLFTGQKDWSSLKSSLQNPGIVATIVGLILYAASVRLPLPLFKALNLVGSMTTPLSMLIIGTLLAKADYKDLFRGRHLLSGIAIRLLGLPLLLFAILHSLGITGVVANVLVLVTAMPAAAITVIFAEKHQADALLASRFVALSTLLSLVTLPGLILFLSAVS